MKGDIGYGSLSQVQNSNNVREVFGERKVKFYNKKNIFCTFKNNTYIFFIMQKTCLLKD